MTTKSRGEEIENPVRKRLLTRPSLRKPRPVAEMESPSTIFEKDEEMDGAENGWSNQMSTGGVDQSIIELLNTTWDEERNAKKGKRSARESTSHSTMTSCVSSFRDRKSFPESKCMMSQSMPNGDRGSITKETIKMKRPRSLKSKVILSNSEVEHRSKSQINNSRCVLFSKSPSEKVPAEFDAKTNKKYKSIKTNDSIAKFLERQKRAFSKGEETDQRKHTQSIAKQYVSKYLSPRVCASRSETSIASRKFRSQAKNCSSDRLSPAMSNKKLKIRRSVIVKKERRVNDKDQRRTRTCSPGIDLEPLKPRRHKSKRKTSIGQGPTKNLQITKTSTYAISMDRLITDQMLQLADSMQSVKSNMTHSKGSLSEKRTDSSLKKLHGQATHEISQSAKDARVYRETDHWSESGTSRLDSFTRRSDKPIILSCCSSGRIPDLVVVHRSSERLSSGRISARSLRDRVRSIDVMERVDSSRRYSPSNDRVYNTLQSTSTSRSFRDKQVSGILEEELNDSHCPSSDRLRHHPRESGTSVGTGSYHRRSPSIEEMRDRIYSRSTTDRFINTTSDTSNEIVSSKFRSSSSTDSSRFQHRTLSISTEQLKAKLHSNLKPERLTECSTDLCSIEQLKMIRNSKITSKCISEEFASCASNEHLERKECLSSNVSEVFNDSCITSAHIQKENKRSGSQTSSGVRIKRGSHSSTKPSNTNTRSTSKSSTRQSRRTPSTSTEKLRQSLRSGSRTSYRLQNRQSPSPISAQDVDKQMITSRTSAGVTHEHAPIISSEQLNKQLRQSSSTTCTTNTSIKKLISLTACRLVSDKQIPCALVEQSKSRGRSRISSPRWTAENTTVEKVASAQIPPRTAMMKGTAKMSEGMIASNMANLNVLWSKDGADVGDGEEQRRKIREFLGIGCEHIDRPLSPAKPNVVIVKQRELGVQTHYAITDTIIPLAEQSRGQFAFEGPREKEVQTEEGSFEGLVTEKSDPRLGPKEPFKLKHTPSALWNFSVFILSTLWSSILGPILNLCLLILLRAIVPTLWIAVGIATTMMVQHMVDQYEHPQSRKHTIGTLRIVKDIQILMNYMYQGVDNIFGGYLRISKPAS